MRISGIASGFDTDEMVKSMMAVERLKVDRVAKNKQTVLWRQESYNTMNKAFANFILNTQKDVGLKRTSSTGLITGSSYKNVDYVKKATSSNEAAATVTSSSKAVNGSYKIDVEQLAEGASFSSADMRKETFGPDLTFNINGHQVNVTASNKINVTMDDVAKAINNTKGKILDGKAVVDGNFVDDHGKIIGALSDEQKEELKGIKEVSLGVPAFYDKGNGRLFMQTKETGGDAKINISSDFASKLGYTGDEKVDKAKYSEGQNAEIQFNGVKLEYASNNINLNGLDIEVKGVTTIKEKDAPHNIISTNPISINVSTNTQGIMEKVEKLVKDYNDLIDLASKSLSEKSYSGYQPLTSEERKAMNEDDLKLWDEKAKSGLLNRDETITRTLQAIRNDLYKTVEGLDEFNHITQIGITTEKYSRGSAGGKLEINKEKLQEAIEKNPDAVMDLLFTEGKDVPDAPEGTKPANGTTKKGIFTNIYDNLITGMKAIVDKSGPGQDSDLLRGVNSSMLIDFVTKKSSISDIDKAVQDMNKQMDSLNVLLGRKEDSYYAKFTAMEKNMHKMNGQSGWLQQQFG